MRARHTVRSGLMLVMLSAGLLACGGGGGAPSIGSLVLLPVTPGAVGGGPQLFKLSVRAADQDTGAPLGAATVVVGHGGGVATGVTNPSGVVSFSALTPGAVTVTIIKADYIPATIVDVDARWIELPLISTDWSGTERALVPLGLPNTYVGGRGEVIAGPAGPYPFDLVDGGGGTVGTDPDPLPLYVVDNLPTALLVLAYDPADPLGLSVYQGYREYPAGVPLGTVTLPLEPRMLRAVAGVISVPDLADGGFDLTEPDVDVDVLAFAHLAALGDLTTGGLQAPPTIQSRTFASFEPATGNGLHVAHVPRDGMYAIGAAIDDDSIPGEERHSVQLYRAQYSALPAVIALDDFRRPPTAIEVSRSPTPTITWTHADPPGRDGGLLAIGLFGDDPETSWVFYVPGDATSLSVPGYTGLALAPSMEYDVSVGAIYVPTFEYTAFTFAELLASWTHNAGSEATFLTPDS